MTKKLTIKTYKKPAVVINRSAVVTDHLVYIATANKKIKYPYEQSKIVYIGTTKAGASRIAASAAAKAKDMLSIYGVKHLQFYVITCTKRKNVHTWKKMERGLLLCFRSLYGDIPKCNSQGKHMKWTDELEYFTEKRLRTIIEKHS